MAGKILTEKEELDLIDKMTQPFWEAFGDREIGRFSKYHLELMERAGLTLVLTAREGMSEIAANEARQKCKLPTETT